MSINWFTVIAQIINFLILVAVLKRFLYKPILLAIDEREKKVRSQIANAEQIEAEAKQIKNEFQLKSDQLTQTKTQLLQQVYSQAELEKQQLENEARAQLLEHQTKWKAAFAEDQRKLLHASEVQIVSQVIKTSELLLTTLAEQTLEEQMIKQFLHRMVQLPEVEKAKLFEAASRLPDSKINITTSFTVSTLQQKAIALAIEQFLAQKIEVNYNTDTSLISGIICIINGYKLEWSIAEALEKYKTSLIQ